MGTDGREGGIHFANGAGEIKASASALAGDFNFPPLTLWRARMTRFFAQLAYATNGCSFGKNFIISRFIIVFG
jgi:hypothetical protein